MTKPVFIFIAINFPEKTKNCEEASKAFSELLEDSKFVLSTEGDLPALKGHAKKLNVEKNNINSNKSPQKDSKQNAPTEKRREEPHKVTLVPGNKSQSLRIFEDFKTKHKSDPKCTK